MMHIFTGRSANDVYTDAIETVMDRGADVPVARRDAAATMTKEIHPALFQLSHPRYRLVTAHGRPINVAFAMAEVLWILAGRSDVEMLRFYNSTIGNYSDNGRSFNAAYGARLRTTHGHDQLADMIAALKADPTSRQAVSVIWHPLSDRAFEPSAFDDMRERQTRDRACNISSMLLIRDGKLDWTQTMRSNDALWGWPYNVIQWTMLMEYAANMIGVDLGSYYHLSNSFHIYEHQFREAQDIRHFDIYEFYPARPSEIGGSAAIELATEMEHQVRQYGVVSMDGLSDFWRDCLRLWTAHSAYKQHEDMAALRFLVTLHDEALGAAQLRFYWAHRWMQRSGPEIATHITDNFPPEVAAWIMGDDATQP